MHAPLFMQRRQVSFSWYELKTHTNTYNMSELTAQIKSDALADKVFDWCKQVESGFVQKCEKCGLDASREGKRAWVKEREAIDKRLECGIQDRCSNPTCTATVGPCSVHSTVKLKKCARCLMVAYCRFAPARFLFHTACCSLRLQR